MRSSNVLKFPGGKSSDWNLKLFGVVFHFFVAGYLAVLGTTYSGNGFMFLILLGVLYQFFVRLGVRYQSYLQQNRWLLIILSIIFLLVFQWQMLLLLAIALFYWLLVGRLGQEAPYFIRFHILTALILNFFILLAYFLLLALLNLLGSIFSLIGLNMLLQIVLLVSSFRLVAFMGIFGLVALWLSWNVLMGRTPYIGWVTVNVRHWVQ